MGNEPSIPDLGLAHRIQKRISGLVTYAGEQTHLNGLYIAATFAVTSGSGFFFWLIAAQTLSPEELGMVSSLVAAVMLLSTIATLGIPHGLVRFLGPLTGTRRSELINTGMTLAGTTALVVSGIFIVGVQYWVPALAPTLFQVQFIAIFALFTVAVTLGPLLLLYVFAALRSSQYGLLQGTVEAVSKLVLVTFLSPILGVKGTFAAWGGAISLGFLVGVLLLLPRREPEYRVRLLVRVTALKRISRFALANYVSDLSWFTPTSGVIGWILPMLVLGLTDLRQAGIFYIVWSMTGLVNAIPTAISVAMLAEAANRGSLSLASAVRGLSLTLALLVPVVAVLAIAGDRLLGVFSPVYAEEGTDLLRILAFSTPLLAFNVISLTLWRTSMSLGPIVSMGLLVASITFTVAIIWTPQVGITAVGWGWLSAQTAGALLVSPFAWRPRSRHSLLGTEGSRPE